MSNILLVEPDYRSKFPPLGLLRIASYHKSVRDSVTFTRGCVDALRSAHWHRIYVSSLYTWELPRTVRTVQYYGNSVSAPTNIVVGGIGVTLMPGYVQERVPCTVVCGRVDRRGKLGRGTPSLERYIPDYSILDTPGWTYEPRDSYFCRTTKGCIRTCKFCAVPRLEPHFARNSHWRQEIAEVARRYGERQNLVLLDNNVLASPHFEDIIAGIRAEGFERGSLRNGRKRTVDFNQGIDARLVTKQVAKRLATVNLSPVRLAFDFDALEPQYRKAVSHLADAGFRRFTNYLMFNFNDTPKSLYRRMKLNLELSRKLGVEITGFPMRFIPTNDVDRRYVSPGWKWRYLRGIQCVLLATHGMVSPNREFFGAAFGNSYTESLEILSMPDRYIIQREEYKDNEAANWLRRFRKLSTGSRNELLDILHQLNGTRDKRATMAKHKSFRDLLDHYYPRGKVLRE
jgi:hypothetical protein